MVITAIWRLVLRVLLGVVLGSAGVLVGASTAHAHAIPTATTTPLAAYDAAPKLVVATVADDGPPSAVDGTAAVALEASPASWGELSAPEVAGFFGRSLDDLSAAAGAAGKGDFTVAGHALTKHAAGQRAGSGAFPALRGGPGQINELAQFQVDDILTYPGSQFLQRSTRRYGDVLDVFAPDGRGVRFGSDGRFIGFLEPRR